MEYNAVVSALTVYRHVMADPAVELWRQAAARIGGHHCAAPFYSLLAELIDAEAQLPALPHCDLWQCYLLRLISLADNAFTRRAETGKPLSENLAAAAAHDLELLEHMYRCTLTQLRPAGAAPSWPGSAAPAGVPPDELASWLSSHSGWAGSVETLARLYAKLGSGVVGRYHVLRFTGDGLEPVLFPSAVSMRHLVGYELQRRAVWENTKRFAAGLTANNMLLYGDRGTGKSATVKAVCAEFYAAGLRLIETPLETVAKLTKLFQLLRERPYRFVVFVDDLSVSESDPYLHQLKVVLEGSVECRPDNVIVYATSNRRHLVPEYFGDREGEVRSRDAVEEKLALADRFGRTVIYPSPSQDEFLAIVESLAQQAGIPLSGPELRARALRWAQYENGRSARAAKQFVFDLAGELGTPVPPFLL